jgi:hypothetical protein
VYELVELAAAFVLVVDVGTDKPATALPVVLAGNGRKGNHLLFRRKLKDSGFPSVMMSIGSRCKASSNNDDNNGTGLTFSFMVVVQCKDNVDRHEH